MSEDAYTRPANRWFCKELALRELMDLKFAFAALAEQSGSQGSYQREMAKNASKGFDRRVDYLHDSITRLIPK